jgi:hypothetical protein
MVSEEDVVTAFALGLAAAELAHGIGPKGLAGGHRRVAKIVRAVASGNVTLQDTAEEVADSAQVPKRRRRFPPGRRAELADMRARERRVAQLLAPGLERLVA